MAHNSEGKQQECGMRMMTTKKPLRVLLSRLFFSVLFGCLKYKKQANILYLHKTKISYKYRKLDELSTAIIIFFFSSFALNFLSIYFPLLKSTNGKFNYRNISMVEVKNI